MRRDFTYIDDIMEGVIRTADRTPTDEGEDSPARRGVYRTYNIGNHQPVELMEMIRILEKQLGKEAEKNLLPMQPGDVPTTYADVDALRADVGFCPATPLETGISRFVEWYREFYNV